MVVALLRPATVFPNVAVMCCLLTGWLVCPSAEDKTAAILFVNDTLVSPHRTAVIEARLLSPSKGKHTPAAGELLELVQDGKILTTATTDGSGIGKLQFVPLRKGSLNLIVRLAESSRLSARSGVTVAAWERRTPLLLVEIAALSDLFSQEPMADAVEELRKLTQFYYNVIYVTAEAGDSEAQLAASNRTRQWLAMHHFPIGYVLVLPSSGTALGAKIDELRSAGWTTLKVGIGRSKEFAEAFVQRRLEAVMVPEPARGNVPKRAKVAKDWKDVRKKL